MEHVGKSRQGNIDFQIAFHSKHQAPCGLSEIQADLSREKEAEVHALRLNSS